MRSAAELPKSKATAVTGTPADNCDRTDTRRACWRQAPNGMPAWCLEAPREHAGTFVQLACPFPCDRANKRFVHDCSTTTTTAQDRQAGGHTAARAMPGAALAESVLARRRHALARLRGRVPLRPQSASGARADGAEYLAAPGGRRQIPCTDAGTGGIHLDSVRVIGGVPYAAMDLHGLVTRVIRSPHTQFLSTGGWSWSVL